ncbi:di-heme oxidoredictase family protein [Tropicibacter sp. Alg240-R139]|uniref:di-heme oxidoredictase family protein n=1 Tax=Tropicibacter sp. Alg240-R139 TaxID=2305991 RepID=UPI0013DF7AC2|nr:di-heme oxidoredictase family protein [Tropicibacter sp. Alg240-R139]
MTYSNALRLGAVCLAFSYQSAWAEAPPQVNQVELNRLLAEDRLTAFEHAFEAGDEITEATYTLKDGAGAAVAAGQSFTRLPRADLTGTGEWAMHFPTREGGPQAQSCIACHAAPLANGAGPMAVNVAVDPLHTGDPSQFLERNTLHLFGLGAVQRVAEEMTMDLHAIALLAADQACADQAPVTLDLTTKGVGFGNISAQPEGGGDACTAKLDRSQIKGVDPDLVVRMFGWKGNHSTLRAFARNAAHNEMGLQAVELVGQKDGDYDGVTEELSIGDLTAVTIYMAALERPTSLLELADLGLHDLTKDERARIERGQERLAQAQCTACHVPSLPIESARFSEPSAVPGFAEDSLPDGSDAMAQGLYAQMPLWFDLTSDQPNNRIDQADGTVVQLGSFPKRGATGATLTWYSDFRRHDMGPGLADPVDAFGFGASVWPTRSLAGVGSTGPWLHNGHATTLRDAITAHGGDAMVSKQAFLAMESPEQEELIAFLENLVIVNLDPEEEGH